MTTEAKQSALDYEEIMVPVKPQCVCEIADWYAVIPICSSPDYGGDFTAAAICDNCQHDKACHAPPISHQGS